MQAASKMVFVPAASDAGDVGVLPQRPLLPSVAEPLAAAGVDVTFASNPCRIHFYTKQVVVFASPCLEAFQGRSLVQQPRAPLPTLPTLPPPDARRSACSTRVCSADATAKGMHSSRPRLPLPHDLVLLRRQPPRSTGGLLLVRGAGAA